MYKIEGGREAIIWNGPEFRAVVDLQLFKRYKVSKTHVVQRFYITNSGDVKGDKCGGQQSLTRKGFQLFTITANSEIFE